MSLEKHKRKGKMGVTKWEGVIVGYPVDGVGYPFRGKILNVVVPHVDESDQPGWWRKDAGGVGTTDIEVIVFPDLAVDEEGAAALVQEQAQERDMPSLVEDSSSRSQIYFYD